MPKFHHNLMDIGSLCNHDCHILFENTAVTVSSKDNAFLLRGHRETIGAKLWRFSFRPHNHPATPTQWKSGPVALNANDLPSVGALVR